MSLVAGISANLWRLDKMFMFSLENAIWHVAHVSVTGLKIYAIWTIQPITEAKLKRWNLLIERVKVNFNSSILLLGKKRQQQTNNIPLTDEIKEERIFITFLQAITAKKSPQES